MLRLGQEDFEAFGSNDVLYIDLTSQISILCCWINIKRLLIIFLVVLFFENIDLSWIVIR